MNVAAYSGLASFSVRPRQDERLGPVFALFMLAVLVFGRYLPRLWALAREARPDVPGRAARYLLTAGILAAPLLLTTGYHAYLHNEPLRHSANVALGLLISASFLIFFSQTPRRGRGFWFGLSTSAGIFCWRFLMLSASASGNAVIDGMPAGLYLIYIVHYSSIAALSLLVLAALRRPQPVHVPPAVDGPPAPTAYTGGFGKLLSAAVALNLMNGFLDAKLFPLLIVAAPPSFSSLYVIVIFCCPFAGWFLDKNPRGFELLVRPSSWLFILSPSLVAMGGSPRLYVALHILAVIGQFVMFVTFSVTLGNLARNGAEACWLTSAVYSMRLLPMLAFLLLRQTLNIGPGMTVLFATLNAFLFYQLARIPPLPQPEETADAGIGIEENATTREARTVGDFLASRNLTPREYEVAELILRGKQTRVIAETLGISEHTVKTHVLNILKKYGAPNRKSLILACFSGVSPEDAEEDDDERLLPQA